MSYYRYNAKTLEGEAVHGNVEAENGVKALAKVRDHGLFPTAVSANPVADEDDQSDVEMIYGVML